MMVHPTKRFVNLPLSRSGFSLLVSVLLLSSGLTSSAIAQTSPAPGTIIDNQATGSFVNPGDNSTQLAESNIVSITVAEVAGITVTASGSNDDGEVNPDDVISFDFTITNVGNDPTQFFIPGAPSTITNGAAGTLQIIAYDPDGTGTEATSQTVSINVPGIGISTGDASALNLPNGAIPPGGTVTVQVPVTVDSGATAGAVVSVTLGETTADGTGSTQNQPYIAETLDVYTQDNQDTDAVNSPLTTATETEAAGVLLVGAAKEASASQDSSAIAATSSLPPFASCPADAYLTKTSGSADSQLLGIDLVTGNETLLDNALESVRLNATGFNRKDSYIYGIDIRTDHLIQVGGNYEVNDLGAVTGLPSTPFPDFNTVYDSGDVNQDGILYVLVDDNTVLYRIDVDSNSPTFGTLLSSLTVTGITGFLNDFAFHPNASADGKFYIFGVSTQGGLYRVDPDTGTTVDLGNIGITGQLGAAYFDAAGFLYVSNNFTGDIYRINLSDPDTPSLSADVLGQGTIASGNDGARCATAPVAVDFGDAPDTATGNGTANYNTLLSDNGPRHRIDGATYLGSGVSLDTDGFGNGNDTNNDATDDNDDDGIALGGSTLQGQTLTLGDTITLDVTATGGGVLNAWVDWNNDGVFDVAAEAIAMDADVSGGTLSVTVPAGATVGNTYARFRYSSETGLAPTGAASDGEVEDYQIEITASVSSRPNVVLVKRITAINRNQTQNPNDNTALNAVVNDGTANSPDDESRWPTNYLLGEVNAGLVKPGDEIEYTVYFLNTGADGAHDVRICDWIQPHQSTVTGLYGGNDIELQLSDGAGAATYYLTMANDASDRAQLATVGNLPAGPICDLPAAATTLNDNVLVIDLTGTTGDPAGLTTTLPGSTRPAGAPDNAFGFFRFTTKLN